MQEILREEKSLGQLASEYEEHVTQLRKWKQKALEGLSGLFRGELPDKQDDLKKLEEEQERLYAEIGRLPPTTHNGGKERNSGKYFVLTIGGTLGFYPSFLRIPPMIQNFRAGLD